MENEEKMEQQLRGGEKATREEREEKEEKKEEDMGKYGGRGVGWSLARRKKKRMNRSDGKDRGRRGSGGERGGERQGKEEEVEGEGVEVT